MLVSLTRIDYDRHIALVAFLKDNDEEEMVGVARVIMGPDRSRAEFSVVAGDPWQGKGIGRKLLERYLDVGRDCGVKTVFGSVLAENVQMLVLAPEMGFSIPQAYEASSFDVSLELQ